MRTAAQIMADMLARVPNDVDKRDGSLIYHAIGPVSEQLEEVRLHIDNVQDTMMPDTARGADQDRVNGQQGVNRLAATQAVRQAEFYADETARPPPCRSVPAFQAAGLRMLSPIKCHRASTRWCASRRA